MTKAAGGGEWSAEARIGLSFKVNEAAVQSLLPPGWQVAPSTAAANLGANLTITFMDRLLVLDSNGALKGTGTTRYAVVSTPAMDSSSGWTGTMVVGGISPEGRGAYDVYLTATEVSVARSSSANMEEGGTGEERWRVSAATGDRVDLQVRYRRGPLVRARVDIVIRSAAHTDFTRTYHIDQATDVLRSVSSPIDRLEEVTFQATGPWFSRLFDGSEQLLSVTSVPYYARTIEIP